MKIQRNKNVPNLTAERASVPGAAGNVTIEAAFGIPLFLFAVLCLIFLIEIQSLRVSLINAAQNAAKNAAGDMAAVPVLNTIKMKSDIVSLIGAERMENSILDGGESAVSCIKSYVVPGTGLMNVTVEYRIRIPLPLLGSPSAELKEEFRMSTWSGFEDTKTENRDPNIVYMSQNGLVYHQDYQCSYLQLSIRFVPYSGVNGLRNLDGGIYYPCEKCVYGEAMAGVYITERGSSYHNSLSCSGLKRTVRAVEKSEVNGMGACSRCSR